MGLTFRKDDFLEKRLADFGLDLELSETEKQAIEARKAAERFLEPAEEAETPADNKQK